MIVAGEASGDKHGAALAFALKKLAGSRNVSLFGSGGTEMRAAGVETVVDCRELGIIGIPEILRALPRFYGAYRRLVAAALERRADVVVLIDWPDFNLRLGARLHRNGFKIVYYISPQVWAWRKYRVRAILRLVDQMLVILPFEEEFYRREGVPAEYVGHPLSGVVSVTSTLEEFAQAHGLDARSPIVTLLPGSRRKEVHYHMSIMARAARLLPSLVNWQMVSAKGDAEPPGSERAQGCVRPQFVVPLASTVDRAEVEAVLDESGQNITIVEGDTYNAVGHSVLAVVASGTATVEAALLGVPMVVIYRGSEINWRLIRPLINLDTFAMVNLIAGSRVVPELIQHAATPPRIAGEAASILSDSSRLSRMKEELEKVATRLRFVGPPPPELVARRVIDVASGQASASVR